VLSGGHDHALVAAFAPDQPLPDGFVRVGSVTEQPHDVQAPTAVGSAEWVTVDGSSWAGPTGHAHFS
jgi:thiamine-monophosphate kinase